MIVETNKISGFEGQPLDIESQGVLENLNSIQAERKFVSVDSAADLAEKARSIADERMARSKERVEAQFASDKKITSDMIGPNYGINMKKREEAAYEAKAKGDKGNLEEAARLNSWVEVLSDAPGEMLAAQLARGEALRIAKKNFDESKRLVSVGPDYGVRQAKQEADGFTKYQEDQRLANEAYDQSFRKIDEAAKNLGISVTAEQLIMMANTGESAKMPVGGGDTGKDTQYGGLGFDESKVKSLYDDGEEKVGAGGKPGEVPAFRDEETGTELTPPTEEEIDTTPLDEAEVPEVPEGPQGAGDEAAPEGEEESEAHLADVHKEDELSDNKPVVVEPDVETPDVEIEEADEGSISTGLEELEPMTPVENRRLRRGGNILLNGVKDWWKGVMPVDWFTGEAAGVETFRDKEKFNRWRKSFNVWNLAYYYGGVAVGTGLDFFKLIPGGSTVARLALNVAVPFAMGRLETAAEKKAIRGMTADQAAVELAEMRERKSKLDTKVANFAHGVAAGMVASTLFSAGRDLFNNIFGKEAHERALSHGVKAVTPEAPATPNAPNVSEPTIRVPYGVEPPVEVVKPEIVFKAVEGTGFHHAVGIDQLGLPQWADLMPGSSRPEDIVGFAIRNSAQKFGSVGDQISFKDLSPAAKALIEAMKTSPNQAMFLANGGQELINNALKP